jgi:protein tyrosine/serine phosphatase
MPMRSVRARIHASAFILLLAMAAPYQAFADRPQPVAGISIGNFGQISDVYFRGAQPVGHDYQDLAALGVKTVIDLSDEQVTEAASVQAAGMHFVRIPLTTSAAPPQAAVDQFLAIVNEPANQPVYVHCQGGRHRTGVMTAVYRMTHDRWTADRAFHEMKQFEFKKGIVSHGALKSFVYKFTPAVGPVVAVPGTDERR